MTIEVSFISKINCSLEQITQYWVLVRLWQYSHEEEEVIQNGFM